VNKRVSLRERFEEGKKELAWGIIKAVSYVVIPFIPIALWLTKNTNEDIARREAIAREDLFADHPELELHRWGIPTERYHPEAVVEIVDAVSTLLDGQAEHLEEPPEYFDFSETGEVSTEMETCIAEDDMQFHLAVVLLHWQIEEATEEHAYDFNTAEKFCRWLVAAVAVKPDLLADYTGIIVPDPPRSPRIRFTPKTKWRADRMHGWK
jgi:hypothetical protein